MYRMIRNMIKSERYEDAEDILINVEPRYRNAEWHYLTAVVYMKKGWIESAYQHSKSAYELDPECKEYSDLYNKFEKQRDIGVEKKPVYDYNDMRFAEEKYEIPDCNDIKIKRKSDGLEKGTEISCENYERNKIAAIGWAIGCICEFLPNIIECFLDI